MIPYLLEARDLLKARVSEIAPFQEHETGRETQQADPDQDNAWAEHFHHT
jgi:hypothetical protein